MKNILLVFFLALSRLTAQTVVVVNADNGIRTAVPTSASNQLLPVSGTTNSVQMWNGSTWANTGVTGTTFQTLVNYWTKTGNDLSYLSGNVNIGSQSVNIRQFDLSGNFGIIFNSSVAPPATGSRIMNFGMYNALPTLTDYRYDNFFAFADLEGRGAGTYFNINSNSGNPAFANMFFRAAGTTVGWFNPDGLALPNLPGNTNRIAVLNSADRFVDGPAVSLSSATTGQALVWDGSQYSPLTYALRGTVTLDFPSTNNNTSSDLTLTVTGAAVGDPVSVSPPVAAISNHSCYTAWVSSANTVTVRFNHYGASGPTDPASGTFQVIVHKY